MSKITLKTQANTDYWYKDLYQFQKKNYKREAKKEQLLLTPCMDKESAISFII